MDLSDSESEVEEVSPIAQAVPAKKNVVRAPHWRRELRVEVDPNLNGDRIVMHQSVLQEILSAAGAEPLPNPLSFKIAPLGTTAIAFGAVKEFTASSEDIVQVSQTLAERILSNEMEATTLATITCVSLSKCEYLKIAPLDPEYLQIPDLRALLESHLRQNFSCISEGDVLIVSSPLKKLNLSKSTAKDFRFLVSESKPEKSCSCIDVDINLDVVPLDVGLAEDAVRQKFFGSQAENFGTKDIFFVSEGDVLRGATSGAVSNGAYAYYRIQTEGNKAWNYTATLTSDTGDCDLFVSVSGNEKPTLEEHDYYNIDEGESRISFSFGGTDAAMDVPYLYVGVRGYTTDAHFNLAIARSPVSNGSSASGSGSASVVETSTSEEPLPDHTTCSNCFQQVPQRTLPMHEAFCFRNNAICTRCRTASTNTHPLAYVFKKSEFASHWHCDACPTVGNTLSSKEKHEALAHTTIPCECGVEGLELQGVAEHYGSQCPERLIVCRYCHLRVRAGKKSLAAKDLMSGLGLSEHESVCGSRTIECIKCKANVQLKDVQVHAKVCFPPCVEQDSYLLVAYVLFPAQFHEVQKQNQKLPPLCPNSQCSNAPNAQYPNMLSLCQPCFSPYWFPSDPQNTKVATKLLGAYHQQLTAGCGRPHCTNRLYCATVKEGGIMNPNDAAVVALEALRQSALFKSASLSTYHLCVPDAKNAKRREMADSLQGMGFHVSWCVKALAESDDDAGKATTWLLQNAPSLSNKK
ncbi:hypothetical protein HDU81_000510 [Chytriomyces hyalinus]|nr:hypothetical protein HDU81_000510 [Chytriomyces hyalinus]